MGNAESYIDFNRKVSMPEEGITDDFVNDVYDYLEEYSLITELNASFLTSGDPSKDPRIKKLCQEINDKYGTSYMAVSLMPFASEGDHSTLKCIYDVEEDYNKMQKIGRVILKAYFKN
ncbi:hypothetical protein GIX77_00655 [Lactobacillus reuteri]|uniref:Uncharacterized protein n=1 Tax=Limosilactobacillus reuteri TaxID=1598 RepID=A0A7X2G2C5_LIMRT|nr:hypothetical protein [Limosilactobacillus reuteri]MRH71157.1 hypothetical protein [Limosilactobacillus reuteri]MRH79302.1 hypothetical protein [Limosilactobacillus reuteri]